MDGVGAGSFTVLPVRALPRPLLLCALAVPSVPRDVVAPRYRCAACGHAALGTGAGVNAQRLLAATQCRQKAWRLFALPHHNTGAAITLPHIRPRLRRYSACSWCCESRCASSSRCWSRSCTVDSCTLSHRNATVCTRRRVYGRARAPAIPPDLTVIGCGRHVALARRQGAPAPPFGMECSSASTGARRVSLLLHAQ